MIENFLKDINKIHLLEKINSYKAHLIKWGKIHNLTGNENKIDSHIIDSLRVFTFLENFNICADIGSGAGFPAIIMSMLYENQTFFLLEPRVKRTAFLHFVKSDLALKNIEIINKYSHDISHTLNADLLTSRAVCNVENMLQNAFLLNENAKFLLFKGQNVESEIADLKLDDLKIIKYDNRNYLYFKKGK